MLKSQVMQRAVSQVFMCSLSIVILFEILDKKLLSYSYIQFTNQMGHALFKSSARGR